MNARLVTARLTEIKDDVAALVRLESVGNAWVRTTEEITARIKWASLKDSAGWRGKDAWAEDWLGVAAEWSIVSGQIVPVHRIGETFDR